MGARKRGRQKKSATRRKKAASVSVVVGSKVKEVVRGHGVRMAGDLLDALNGRVLGLLDGAVSRAQANGRGTVRPQDL